MAQRSMGEILSRDPAKAEAAEPRAEEREEREPEAKAKPEPEAREARTEKAPKAQEPKPAAQAKEPDDEAEAEDVPDNLDGLKRALAAARGDKRKARKAWRETELQLAELRGKLDVTSRASQPQQPQPAVKPEPPKGPVLDEDAFYSQGPVAVQSYLDARMQQERESWAQQANMQRHLDRSEARAMAKHTDYAEKFEAFKAAAAPHVVQQMLADEDPAEFVYEWAKAHEIFRDTPSIDALRDKLREELRAELAAETGTAAEATPRPPQPQRSLASARGTGAHSRGTWSGPRSMTDILAR